MDFIVNPAVLIPRPETEHLVETALELARGFVAQPQANWPKIVDVGTGSGAIALALAKELPNADVLAVDVSPPALDVARANAARLELAHRVRFAESNVLARVERDGTFDFVVSNPPYVGLDEADKVQDVVKKFEPIIAVFAGDNGMSVIHRLIPQAYDALREGGWLLMEIGYSMSPKVMELLGRCWTDVHAVPDLAGIPRVVVARKATADHQPSDEHRNARTADTEAYRQVSRATDYLAQNRSK